MYIVVLMFTLVGFRFFAGIHLSNISLPFKNIRERKSFHVALYHLAISYIHVHVLSPIRRSTQRKLTMSMPPTGIAPRLIKATLE